MRKLFAVIAVFLTVSVMGVMAQTKITDYKGRANGEKIPEWVSAINKGDTARNFSGYIPNLKKQMRDPFVLPISVSNWNLYSGFMNIGLEAEHDFFDNAMKIMNSMLEPFSNEDIDMNLVTAGVKRVVKDFIDKGDFYPVASCWLELNNPKKGEYFNCYSLWAFDVSQLQMALSNVKIF